MNFNKKPLILITENHEHSQTFESLGNSRKCTDNTQNNNKTITNTHTNKINRYASRPCRNSVRGALLPNSFCVTLEHTRFASHSNTYTHTVTLRRSANELVDRHVMRMERFALKFLEHDILRKHTRELIKRNEETLLIHWIDSVLELIDHKTLN